MARTCRCRPVVLSWQGAAASDPDAPALKVLDAILSAGKSSRLYNSLVYDKQISVQAFSRPTCRTIRAW
jgi:zinc protease